MTTTGEYLVSLSSIPTGSALAHLLAIQTGIGTGDSFYSGTVQVVTSRPDVFVQRKARMAAVEQESKEPRVSSAPNNKSRRVSSVFVTAPQTATYCFSATEEIFVLVRDLQQVTVMTAINSTSVNNKAN